MAQQHSHYFKDVARFETVDVYRVLLLFGVTDPCIQHAVKKLLVAGGRGAGKDVHRDIQEAVDSLERWKDMRAEEAETAPGIGHDGWRGQPFGSPLVDPLPPKIECEIAGGHA